MQKLDKHYSQIKKWNLIKILRKLAIAGRIKAIEKIILVIKKDK